MEEANDKAFIQTKLFVQPRCVVWNTLADDIRNIYMQQSEKPTSSEYHHVYGIGCFKCLHKKFLNCKKDKCLWNLAITQKYHLIIALYMISLSVCRSYI